MMSFFSSKRVELTDHNCVLPHALKIPALEKLVGKRVVLASNSPRRKDILRTFVGVLGLVWVRSVRLTLPSIVFCQGLEPEIVPSTFEETLPFGGFSDPHEYPVATASQKAVEVYRRMVVGHFSVGSCWARRRCVLAPCRPSCRRGVCGVSYRCFRLLLRLP